MESLLDRALDVEGETSVNLSGDFAGNDLEDLLAELDEKTVEGRVDLLVDVLPLREMSDPSQAVKMQ